MLFQFQPGPKRFALPAICSIVVTITALRNNTKLNFSKNESI